MTDYDVIIAGGGPTGIALGIELGLNNIKTLILEKHAAPLISPRAQSLNARSMEFFRRWKLSSTLKAKQLLPADFPIRGVWCSKLNGKAYGISSSNEQLNDSLSPERGVRIPLWITEDVLRDKLNEFSCITFLKQHEVMHITINDNNVQVTAKNSKDQYIDYQANYLIGCDGANSISRKLAGITFETLAPATRVINIMFESPELENLITVPKGFLYYILESARPGAIGPVDPTTGLWYTQIRDDGKADTIDQINLDQLLNEMVGFSFTKKIVQAHFWNMHIQLAKQFSMKNRVFLVGDSAHGFVPTGGFGLNTGLGDVMNIGWKLANIIKKQKNSDLLKTYEQERRPICENNLHAAQKNADDMMKLRKQIDPQKNPEEFANANAELAKQFAFSLGATMGYAYFDSPLTHLQPNQSTQPMPNSVYTPTALPGYFLPHCWLGENQSIYDTLSPINWTLIISDKGDSQIPLEKHGIEILYVPTDTYPSRYILIRPDWHIAFASDILNEIKDFLETITNI